MVAAVALHAGGEAVVPAARAVPAIPHGEPGVGARQITGISPPAPCSALLHSATVSLGELPRVNTKIPRRIWWNDEPPQGRRLHAFFIGSGRATVRRVTD